MAPIVTLTTDFGLRDSFVGIMKGVLLSRAPGAHLVDICHQVPPQNVTVGALRLASAASFFPSGTVHLAVVDPGVGSTRRPIALAAGSQYFVGPDNGVLSLAASRGAPDWRAVHLTNPHWWLPEVSSTFHGRDIFAPVAAALATGIGLDVVGDPIDSILMLDLPAPDEAGEEIVGAVIDVDGFGNLVTNIRGEHVGGRAVDSVLIAGAVIDGLSRTYDPARRLVAVINSDGWIEVASPLGSAAHTLGVGAGEPVRVRLSRENRDTGFA